MWQAPRFWNEETGGLPARLLAPAGALYNAAVQLRSALARAEAASVPVVCVGNPGLGGAGKTPTAIAIARRLISLGAAPHFLTRGYGGRLKGPVRVDPARHDAAAVGDEPLLLAAVAPTHVAASRIAGARKAAGDGAGIIVMDDGFQNPTIAKDLGFLVVDGETGIGNGRVFPAGPLREAIETQLARADAVVLVGAGAAGENFAAICRRASVGIFRAALRPAANAPDLGGRDVVAFCGIARAGKFFASLTAAGATIVARSAFADHHPYGLNDVAAILDLVARHPGAIPVTTAKDLVRLGPTNDPDGRLRQMLEILPVEMVFDDPSALDAQLRPLLAAGKQLG